MGSVFHPLLCAALAAALASVARGGYMGFYWMDAEGASLAGWGNAYFSHTPSDLVAAKGAHGFDRQLLSLSDHFVSDIDGQYQLIDNWEAVWQTKWVPVASELLRNGTIVGFFLGDEQNRAPLLG